MRDLEGFSATHAETLSHPRKLGGTRGENRADDSIADLPGRVSRYGAARHRALEVLQGIEASGKLSVRTPDDLRALARLGRCGEYLGFRHYYTVDQVRLHSADFCKQHLICPLCAIRRGSKLMGSYLPRFEHLIASAPTLSPAFVTLTVRNGQSLSESFGRLRSSLDVLFERRRSARKGNRGASEFAKVAGLVGTIEVTNKGKGWHPHAHMVVLLDAYIDRNKLAAEWKQITGGSFIIDIRVIDRDNPVDAFAEVFKYALKFSEMTPERIWEARRELRQCRLVYSLGCFRGVSVPTELTDEPLDGLPYVEWFYRYLRGVGYSL
jgi:hypothetical protein